MQKSSMARITQFAPEVRVFRWNANSPTMNSAGVVVMRSTTTVLSRSRISPKVQHGVTAPYSVTHRQRQPFLDLNSTEKLLGEVLERNPLLRPCKNFNTVVHKLAEDLFCKFLFSPRLSNRQKPKLVLDLETVVSTEKSDPYVDSLDMHRSIWENEQLRADIADDEGVIPKEIEEVEDFLESGGSRIEAFVPKGLDEEVKPAVEIEVFPDQIDEENNTVTGGGNGDDDRSGAEVCSICLDKLNVGVVVQTSCSHMFHKGCVSEWLIGTSSSCPNCRSSFGISL